MAGATQKGAKPDLASIGGLVLAFVCIIGGLVLEGGKVQDIAQVTAAMIVLGGTLGATMLATPMGTLIGAFKRLKVVFFADANGAPETIEQIIALATKARKSRIVSLEQDTLAIEDPFLKKALSLAVDGTDGQMIRRMMELEIETEEIHADHEGKVFETAGGFAPTIGIIGAVLGLIQVMKHLENIEEVGKGIAVAFVATVYGVAAANLFFLPAAGKIKQRAGERIKIKELMLEGVISIVEGMNPKLIRTKLEAYSHQPAGAKAKGKAAEPAMQQAPAEG